MREAEKITEENVAKRFLVEGRVQGVGFRRYTQKKAVELSLAGWVRNLSNGKVEALASGEARDLKNFEKLLARGPDSSHVEQVSVKVERLRSPLPEPFEIRYSD